MEAATGREGVTLAPRGRYCCACGRAVDDFGPGGPRGRPGAKCPYCGALERHRFLAYLLRQLGPYVASAEAVLDVAPQPQLRHVLTELAGPAYVGVDLVEPRMIDVRADLTCLPFPDDLFDVIICYHVLEHVPDDAAAMAELHRVLRPGGIAMVEVPWRGDRPTDEDPGAPVEERVRRFGQADHVRYYGRDFEPRLRKAGFAPTRLRPSDLIAPVELQRLGMIPSEVLWLCRTAGLAVAGAPAQLRPTGLVEDVGTGPPRSEPEMLWDEVRRLRGATADLRRMVWERDRDLSRRNRDVKRATAAARRSEAARQRLARRRSVRLALSAASVARPAVRVVRSAVRTGATTGDGAVAGEQLPDAPGPYRVELRRRLAPSGRLRLAVLGAAEGLAALRSDGDRPGWRVTWRGATDAGGEADVVILADPTVDGHAVDRTAVLVAVVRDRTDEWVRTPWFDDVDIVLVVDREGAPPALDGTTRVGRAIPAGGLTRVALAGAVEAWVDEVRVAVCTPTPNRELAHEWGDTFFAEALQGEFERSGHPARVYLRDEFAAGHLGRADVAVHLLGLAVPDTRRGQVSVLWVISHPERVKAELCNRYDLVLAASEPYATKLQRTVDAPVFPLLQATDQRRFRPAASGPDHDLLFVANSRWTRRRIVDDLTPTDLDLAVYGKDWTADLIDPRHVRGRGVPNAELHRYYSSAAVVLNDHWPEMAAEGFVSNRVYDALACGAVVVSDPVVGIDEQFDGAVVTYRSRLDLHGAVTRLLGDEEERQWRAERGRAAVLERHTFAHRVERLLSLLGPFLGPAGGAR